MNLAIAVTFLFITGVWLLFLAAAHLTNKDKEE